jgi:hypothetical protein
MIGRHFLVLVALLVGESGVAFVNKGLVSRVSPFIQKSQHKVESPWG